MRKAVSFILVLCGFAFCTLCAAELPDGILAELELLPDDGGIYRRLLEGGQSNEEGFHSNPGQ